MRRRTIPLLAWTLLLALAPMAAGQDSPTDDRDRAVMNRFLAVVEKAPRRGTALDRVYGYHVERGSLDAFLKIYQDRTVADPKDGAAWLIIGLIEAQRGRDASAVAALRKAEATRPDDAMPAYYLGQSLVLVGQPDDAAQAFERAIARKPARAELLEIFQALGRVYQRAHRNEQALAVWSRLEKLFPDDPRVQEQIAASLAEEAQPDQALPRYEALAKATKDRFRQVQFQVDAAELKVRLNRTADAMADFEGLLGKLDPESWLYREVRRKIEEIYTKTDDLAGLAAYYEKWIAKNADDVEAMSRLGKALTSQGRLAEARVWYEKAVKLAPTRRDLRSALIEQLLIEKKFVEAAAQYEAIAKTDPNNPDVLREWGRVVLRDTARPEVDRKKAAGAIWRRLTDARPDDPSTMVAVADLFRSAEMIDEAVALYLSAVAKAPGSPQYAEYLGEFYHRLKRPTEAVATWSKMAAPPNRNAKTLGRLAEVLTGFGYKNEALAAATEAASLDRDDFDVQLRLADLLHLAEKLDDEAKQLEYAAKATTSVEQVEGVLDRQIKNLQMAGKLAGRIVVMRKAADSRKLNTPEEWRVLARYVEADQKPAEALALARLAVGSDPKSRSIPALAMVARLEEATGNLSGAADTLRKLAEVDRRARTEYLTGVARLEARLGRKDAALKAGRDLLAAAPGQLDNHQFFAELCFQLGQVDEGLDALRRAVRLNEADPKALLGLAETLAAQFRTDEAIEMFWRAFDKSPDLEAKLSVVTRLTALYLQRNQFDRLIARLERQGREADRQREMTICLAQAYSASGDYGTARAELERLLSSNPRDTKLLHQLSILSESEGDAATAAKFQKQLVDIAPGDEATARLASLYIQAGEIAEAEALWTRLTASGEPESHRVLMAIDSLLGSGKKEAVLGITENLLRKRPENWEALYREGQALAGLGRSADAATRFRTILNLKGDDDVVGAVAKARKRTASQPGDPNAAANAANIYAPSKSFPLQDRIGRVYNIRGASGIDSRFITGSAWSPDDLGQARMAAVGWLYSMATKAGKEDALVVELRQAAEKSLSDPRPHWTLYYLQLLRIEYPDLFEAAKGLARVAPTDPPAQFAFLNALPIRATSGQSVIINTNLGAADTTPPLPGPDLDLILASYQTLKTRKPDWAHAAILTAVADELKRAKRDEALGEFYKAAVDTSNDAESTASILRLAADRGEVDTVINLLDRYDRLLGTKTGVSSNLYVYYGGYYTYSSRPADSFCRAMLVRLDAKAPGDVARLLDHYLLAARRPDRIARRVRAIASTSSNLNSNNNRFQVWTNKTVRFSSTSYPTPNPYYDLDGIQVLRNAFEQYKRDDLLSDLIGHLKKSLEGGSDVDKTYLHLALCYLQWWNDDKDEALLELTEAAKASKSDPELLLGLAELRAQRNEPEEALKVADSFEPLDQKAMQRREILAIRLAVVTGDVARARKAAERLFGLRLDADTQVQLASQMHQLGMHELAEAVLGRARRRAGGNLTALVALMLQYQRQGKPDVAVQVASQVLRRNPARANPGYYDEGAEARSEAIQVLARSGKIKEMIGRLEDQIKRTPGSLQLHQRLADYYKAAGEKDKAKLEYDAMIKLRPDDIRLRFQIAVNLGESGDSAAAVEYYASALKKEPSLLGTGYYEIQQAFSQAGKFDDLIKIVEDADIRSIGQVYYVARIIQAVIQDKTKRDRGLALFARAWKAFPTQHENLFAYVTSEEIWQLPEMYDYLRESVIPAEGRKSVPAWHGAADILRNAGNGKITTTGGRLLDLAERAGKLETLTAEIEAAEKRQPNWRGGQALRGLVLARRGRPEEARTLVASYADTKRLDAAPANVRQVIGQEWESVPSLRPLALTLYEGAVKDHEFADNLFSFSPVQRLVEMYRVAGRMDDARRELLAFARDGGYSPYNPGYDAYYRIENRSQVASKLIAIGFPADAARLYDESLADTDALALAKNWSSFSQVDELRTGFQTAINSLNPDNLAATFRAQLASPAAIDLLLVVQPRELEDATVVSLLHAAIRSMAKSPGGLDEVRAGLTKRLETQPNDVPGRVALALAILEAGPPEAIAPAVEALAEIVESSPLEKLGLGERANSRQRLEASRQLGLWLVVRACLGKPGLEKAAKILDDRAFEAAARQNDPAWTLAMLRETAGDALGRGDRGEAEAAWSRMLASILARPAVVSVDPTGKGGVPVATLDRFERAARLAKLAADQGMMAFSLRTALEPLRGGPPVVPMTIRSSNNNSGLRNPADRTKEQAIDKVVEARISVLETAWDDGHAPASEVYRTLREIVLPEGRGSEIFIYPQPFGEGGVERPRSVAALLVRWAIRADRIDDLRQAVELRSQQATAEAAARSIVVQLDLARRDFERATQGLQALAVLLAKDKLQSTAETACLAALLALGIPETEAAARPVLELAVSNFVSSAAEEAAVKIPLALARRHFLGHRGEEGRQQVQAVLEALERATSSGQSAYRYYGSEFQTRRENLQIVAAEYARGGQWNEALEALGQSADAPISPIRGIIAGPPFGIVAVARYLATLSPLDRFEKLRAWTMPNESRTTIRAYAAFAPVDLPPESFGRFAPIGDGSGLVSTLELLVIAAREAGKLDDLAADLKQAVEKKREGADLLLTLVEIARGRSSEVEPALQALLVEWSKRVDEVQSNYYGTLPPRANPWPDLLRVRAAMADSKLAGLGRKLASTPKLKQLDRDIQGHLRLGAVDSLLGAADRLEIGLEAWDVSGNMTAATSRQGLRAGRWIAQEGHIHHDAAPSAAPSSSSETTAVIPRPETLVFHLPLTGRFSFRVDASGDGAEIGYGGLMMAISNYDDPAKRPISRMPIPPKPAGSIQPIGAVESIPRVALSSPNLATNRLAIEVEPGSVRFLCNGHLVFEDRDPSPASPWLVLGASGDGEVDFRNLELTGQPTIPRELGLAQTDRLEGWLSDYYNETRPSRNLGPDGRVRPSALGIKTSFGKLDQDWSVRDGEILGRRIPQSGDAPSQSRLAYHRPIRPGESLTYEFLHGPEAATVHPALGRLAFLVEPSGIKLHWMTDGPDIDVSGLPASNLVDDPSSRRGPAALPLKPGEWNKLKLALVGRTVEIDLNGVRVFERDLEAGNDRIFSFYHDKGRVAAKARNVVLKGDWPETVPGGDLARRREVGSAEARQARALAIGESSFARDAQAILQASKALPADRRYETLLAWVLPGENHADFRLAGDFAATDPADLPPSLTIQPGATRVETGGTFDAPALSLVASAREANRLDDLLGRIEKAPTPTDLDRRGKLALLALVLTEKGQTEAAGRTFADLKPLLQRVATDAPESNRWPELVAMAGTLGRDGSRDEKMALADVLVRDQIRKEHKNIGEAWKLHALQVAALQARPDLRRPPIAYDLGLANWSRVTHASSRSRGTGAPLPLWSLNDGTLTHLPGHDRDYVYFRTPLRGDFEVTGESAGGRPLQLAYGGISVGVALDGKEVVVRSVGRPPKRITLDPPLAVGDGPHQVRLAVRRGTFAAFLDDRKLFETGLPANPDPWLALDQPADESGTIRRLKLTGTPSVPDRLELSDQPDLLGWISSEEKAPAADVDPAWQKRGDEIIGRHLKDAAGSRQASVLQYHRPMVEDGAISYEFYQEPGKPAAAPALDRLAFLIEPSGIKIHRIGDAPYDRSAVVADEVLALPAGLSIQPGAWNRMTLAVSGDKVSLRINDLVAYEGPIGPTNQRTFGLFHLADEGEVRVRKVTYQGNWPNQPTDLGFDK